MDGFINVNKAPGMTSFDVIRRLKKIFPGVKLGHLGTLDPMAQGVLPVAMGNATRVIEYVSTTNKVYQATMTLGGVSDTQDAWGKIIFQPDSNFNPLILPQILARYTGIIQQIPPMYSAVHYQGERLYELARKGIVVEREAREVEIEYIECLATEMDSEGRTLIKIEAGCSKGTYIRTLCHDIGTELGTGAYLSELTRIRAGVFTIEDAVSLEDIKRLKDSFQEIIKRIDFPLMHLGQITINSTDIDRVFNGNRIIIDEKLQPGLFKVYDPQGNLISIAESTIDENRTVLQPVKVLKVSGKVLGGRGC